MIVTVKRRDFITLLGGAATAWPLAARAQQPVMPVIGFLKAAVIFATGGGPSVIAAKAATTTVPIVFTFGSDPVKAGLVASFNRPGGNLTGLSWFSSDLGPKRLELLLELAPKTAVIALLVNPNNAELASQPEDFQEAARTLGKQVHIFNASSEKEIDIAFTTFVGQRADAPVVGSDPFFISRREQLVARHWRSSKLSSSGVVVGRIFKTNTAPVGTPWM